eukprot:gb/GECH01006402.1/.p1 GENE.gb/GECH01006402.1/~~gb/GECH01006402.1/.p1  ORF type:complete len:205 (+),score=32.90 gb/GECH01006402.1/:1-615(+)
MKKTQHVPINPERFQTFKKKVLEELNSKMGDNNAEIPLRQYLAIKFEKDPEWCERIINNNQLWLDWIDGVKHHFESSTIYIGIATDGIRVAKSGPEVWPIMIQILNLPLDERTRTAEIFVSKIQIGKPKDFDQFFEALVSEIIMLEKGFTVWNSYTKSKETSYSRWMFNSTDNDARWRLLHHTSWFLFFLASTTGIGGGLMLWT